MSDPEDGAARARFEAIYSGCYREILGYVLRRTRSPEDAADAVAETFATAWRRLDDIPAGDGARLWLYGVARRVLANHHRGEQRRTERVEKLRAELSRLPVAAQHTNRSARRADGAYRAGARRRPERAGRDHSRP